LKSQKLKEKKNIGSDITNQRHISFLSLDNETVETQYQVMVGFKVVSCFKFDNFVLDFLSLQQRLPGMVFVKYQFSF
jgi:hypothetical protein